MMAPPTPPIAAPARAPPAVPVATADQGAAHGAVLPLGLTARKRQGCGCDKKNLFHGLLPLVCFSCDPTRLDNDDPS